MTFHEFVDVSRIACMRYQGTTESWIRSPKHNADVNGHEDSFHTSGEAMDAWFPDVKRTELAAHYLRRMGCWVKRNGEVTLHWQIDQPRKRMSIDDFPS